MKRFTTLALVIFALAAVPSALADDGGAPTRPAATESTAPAAQQDRAQRPAQDPATTERATRPVKNLRPRVHAWVRHCVARTGAAPERCLERLKKILERLGYLDDRIQERIAKLEATCGAGSTVDRCKTRAERLTRLDTRVQKVEQRLREFLDGKGEAPSDPQGELDGAARDLGKLVGSNG